MLAGKGILGLIDKNSHVHVLMEKSKPEKMALSPAMYSHKSLTPWSYTSLTLVMFDFFFFPNFPRVLEPINSFLTAAACDLGMIAGTHGLLFGAQMDIIKDLVLTVSPQKNAQEIITVTISFQPSRAGLDILHFGFCPPPSAWLSSSMQNERCEVASCKPTYCRNSRPRLCGAG